MVPVLLDESLRCLFFVTGASGGVERTMLWYDELLLVLLRAPAGEFEICWADVHISGILGAREQRRALWWTAVKRLSQVDAKSRDGFLRAAHSYFNLERSLDFYRAHHPQTERHFCLLTRTELQRLADAGMSIGAHTLTHPILAQLPPDQAWVEISESRALLEAAVGKRVWAFAYPFGDAGSVTPRVVAMTKEAGFAAAFLNTGGGLGAILTVHALPRVHVSAGMRLPEFEAHVSGFYESLQRSIRRTPQARVPLLDPLRT
jgi:hypothetical protein